MSRSMVFVVLTAAVGCSSSHSAALLPPEGATQQSVKTDIDQALAAARKEAAHAKTLTEPDKTPLEGNSTKGFVREGRVCLRKDGDLLVPGPSQSAFVGTPSWVYLFISPLHYDFYGPEEVTDRYVLHLLERGYRWSEDEKK